MLSGDRGGDEPRGRTLPPTAVALVDGEHYPPVVADALAGLASRYRVVAALLLGGSEKLRSAPSAAAYGVARLERAPAEARGQALAALVRELRPDVVLDLSDEPVVGARTRLALAAHALAAGAAYEGADFRLDPPPRHPYPHPALAVVGTGKRVGKTAVSNHVARLARDRLAPGEVVVVAMGRGGPPEPELVDARGGGIGIAELVERARAGGHAASDFLEDAVLAGVTTVGCRRCGGGLAGAVGPSNVVEGAALAAARRPALTIFEGSGAAAPPIASDRTLLVTAVDAPREELLGYLGPYRLLTADAVLVVGAEPGRDDDVEALRRDLAAFRSDLPVLPIVLRPAPTVDVGGRAVAVFTTAPAAVRPIVRAHLEALGARVVHHSGSLSDRDALRRSLVEPAVRGADLLLTEIKAAGVDVVAEHAVRHGLPVAVLDNVPAAADGSDALERLVAGLVDGARHRHPAG